MQQQPSAPRSSSEVAAAINQLPIEEHMDRDQLAALSARELKVGTGLELHLAARLVAVPAMFCCVQWDDFSERTDYAFAGQT